MALGLARNLIEVHLLGKHASVHSEDERQVMEAKDPSYIIVVDQGSIEAPPIVDDPNTKSLIIDHHLSDKFPKNATVCLLIFYSSPTECAGRLCLSLSTSRHLLPPYIRNLQRLASRYRPNLRLSLCNGNSWRLGQYPQVASAVS